MGPNGLITTKQFSQRCNSKVVSPKKTWIHFCRQKGQQDTFFCFCFRAHPSCYLRTSPSPLDVRNSDQRSLKQALPPPPPPHYGTRLRFRRGKDSSYFFLRRLASNYIPERVANAVQRCTCRGTPHISIVHKMDSSFCPPSPSTYPLLPTAEHPATSKLSRGLGQKYTEKTRKTLKISASTTREKSLLVRWGERCLLAAT